MFDISDTGTSPNMLTSQSPELEGSSDHEKDGQQGML
jgi:hypothetical protein